MTPEPANTQPTGTADRWTRFVHFVGAQVQEPGTRARLRRSLRADDTITADAHWILGACLPEDAVDALVMARTAGWIAAHRCSGPEPGRTIAGEIARPEHQGSERAARQLLEAVTRDGISASVRCYHVTRGLQASPDPKLIDWARMGKDLVGLTRRVEWAHDIRSRWYREYHRGTVRSTTPDATERTLP